MMMPPRNWLAAVLALRTRPQSNEPRKRLTRASPVTAFNGAGNVVVTNAVVRRRQDLCPLDLADRLPAATDQAVKLGFATMANFRCGTLDRLIRTGRIA